MKKKKILKKEVYNYFAVFEPDEERGGYSVIIPALPGCISEGDTFEEAQANIQEAAELYLEVVVATRKKKDFFQKQARTVIAPVQLTR